MKYFLLKTYVAFIFLWVNVCTSQTSNFSLSVTTVNESCPGNGRLNFLVSDATPGATVIFTVYKFPDLTTPIVTTQASTFTGLVAGNYRVVATEALPNGITNTRQRDVLIRDVIVPMQLDLLIENQTCNHAGSITVQTNAGHPVSYEIISGPITFPPQTSNVFTGLVSGTYSVKVFDDCGEFIIRDAVIKNINSALAFSQSQLIPLNCNFLQAGDLISTDGVINYPITVQYTVYESNGNVSTSSQTISSGDRQTVRLSYTVPFEEVYHYKIAVEDACGNIFYSGDIFLNSSIEGLATVRPSNCNGNSSNQDVLISINNFAIPPLTLQFLNSPAGFNPAMFNNSHPTFSTNSILYSNSSVVLPSGAYHLQVTDSCGKTGDVFFNVGSVVLPPSIVVSQLKGCAEGFSSISLATNSGLYKIVSIVLESAPSSYATSFPLNLDSNIYGGIVYLPDLPSGTYRFKVTDTCGVIHDVAVPVVGYHATSSNFNVIEDCSAFRIDLEDISNLHPSLVTFWVQKFNSATNQWVHPITGIYSAGNINSLSAIVLTNNMMNGNITAVGEFRIVKKFTTYRVPDAENPNTANDCIQEIGNFDFYFEPRIRNIYSFSCNTNSYQVIVEAQGADPLEYEIVTKDGQPFYVNNGTSSTFNNLAPGVYGFRVKDNCGNIKNRLFEVSGNVALSIAATPFCNGSVGHLSVPYFPYLQYQWWKDNNTSVILSNTNVLTFNTFNANTDFGTYHVRITNNGNPNTCINFVRDYSIFTSLSNPNAGHDAETTICGVHGLIDLNSFLSANHDLNGTWTETSNSGLPLINGNWNSTAATAGTYTFEYRVNGLCGSDDSATIKINLKNEPQNPSAYFDSHVCLYGELHLYASTIPGAAYSWTGPNGFTSNEQNPVIANVTTSMQGVYSVKAIVDGCESIPSAVQINVNDFPDFQLRTSCEENKKVKVDFTDSTVNPDLYYYDWVYPDGTVVSGNQSIEVIGQQIGSYSVIVSDASGCEIRKAIEISCTFCDIPKGVSANDDGDNDNFDLTCIEDIRNVKIFNRYGVLIFEKDSYLNEWKGYDKKGRLLPAGTYYYLITFNDGAPKSGWVYLNY